MTNSNTVLANDIMNCIVKNFGIVKAESFITYIQSEPMDYTKWAKTAFDDINIDEYGDAAVKYAMEKPIELGPNCKRI